MSVPDVRYNPPISGYGVRSPALVAAAQTLSITGLAGDIARGGGYKLRYFVKNPTTDQPALYLRPEGLTTNLAYTNTFFAEDPATTGIWVCNLRASSVAIIDITFYTATNKGARLFSFSGLTITAGNVFSKINGDGVWTDTTTPITRFDLVASATALPPIGIESFGEATPLGFFY